MMQCTPGQKDRFGWALQLPSLVQKCMELSAIIQDVHLKDLAHVFRTIVEDIFGVPPTDTRNGETPSFTFSPGWNLRAISSIYKPAEFQAVRNFLAPNGPLLSLAFRITNEPLHQFYYPIDWLPTQVRHEIASGTASSFYTSKVQSVAPGKFPTKVVLNAFEYYIFHFAQFLTSAHLRGGSFNPFTGDSLAFSSMNDSLYPVLVEDLLASFLPCNSSLPPGSTATPVTQRGVLSPMSQRAGTFSPSGPASLHLSNLMSPILRPTKPTDPRTPINPSQFYMNSGVCTSSPLPHNAAAAMATSETEVVTWSSQVLLQVLLENWVNQCVSTTTKTSSNNFGQVFGMGQAGVPTTNQWSEGPAFCSEYSIMQDPHFMEYFPNWKSYSRVQEASVPSCDQVKMVRVLIKHLHYFANSMKPQHPSPLDPLRRNVWGMCGKSMYMFLKHLFLHWPFDSSFRLVLETWLSYIQPWRYTNYTANVISTPPRDITTDDQYKTLDRKWLQFLQENLLFYVHLYDLLLSRLLRIDLMCPKNAQIVFRVAKVFGQDQLLPFLEEIEGVLGVNQRYGPNGLAGPGMANGTEQYQNTIQSVLSHINEMEGPRYNYEGIKGKQITAKVGRLVRLIKQAETNLTEELSHQAQNTSTSQAGFLSSIWSYLTSYNSMAEFDVRKDEITKCISHLDISLRHFCHLFGLSAPLTVDVDSSLNMSSSIHNISHLDRTVPPEQILTDEGKVLSAAGRLQMLRGTKRLDIKYEGDPDLRPICSYEVSSLVRLLFALCSLINAKYEPTMISYFYRKDIWGSIVRVFLQPPTTVYETQKISEGKSKRIPKCLPPRVTLRALANKHLIGLVLACWLIFSMLGISSLGVFIKVVIPSVFLFVAFKVLTEAPTRLEVRINSAMMTPR